VPITPLNSSSTSFSIPFSLLGHDICLPCGERLDQQPCPVCRQSISLEDAVQPFVETIGASNQEDYDDRFGELASQTRSLWDHCINNGTTESELMDLNGVRRTLLADIKMLAENDSDLGPNVRSISISFEYADQYHSLR
jgi:hypothetical protein